MGTREIPLSDADIEARKTKLPQLVERWLGAVEDARESAKRHKDNVTEARDHMEATAKEIETGVRTLDDGEEDPRQTLMFDDESPAEVAPPPQAPPAAEHTEPKAKRGRKPKQEARA